METENQQNCESCGMPLDGKFISKLDSRYCVYCQDQETGELKNYDSVRAGSIDAAVRLMGKTPEEAEKMADEILPTLPRWINK
ncbi:zinc ribbon domain-containing protein [bacterium]|nr:zinc ribbon domain-containing protein [bacterium]